MFRRIFSRSPFCRREKETNHEDVAKSIDYFQEFRIGWWPVIIERDQPLIDALIEGKYRLISNSRSNRRWAYVAVSVGPLHTEIVRWHFSTFRWLRLDDESNWTISWRPLQLRPPIDNVSGVAQGPFSDWEVLAGEIASSDDQNVDVSLEVALILRTTRTSNSALWANHVFSLIVIADNGRTKSGYLLSPPPENGAQSDQSIMKLSVFVAYRRQSHELHLFNCENQNQLITWYRYRKRGRRVYWQEGKQEIRLSTLSIFPRTSQSEFSNFAQEIQSDRAIRREKIQNASMFPQKRRNDSNISLRSVREGEKIWLLENRHEILLEFNLVSFEWILSEASVANETNLAGNFDFLTEIRRNFDCNCPTPILVKYFTPFSLKHLAAQCVLRFIHPIFCINPASLLDALPPNRLVIQTVSDMIKEK